MIMNRRTFFKQTALLAVLGIGTPAAAETKPQNFRMNRFSIAGFQYYSGPDLIDRLSPGAALDLTAEPDNRHDYYAVRIAWHGNKLGYVPRSDNRHISRLLRQGVSLRAKVLEREMNSAPWQMVKVEVGLEVV